MDTLLNAEPSHVDDRTSTYAVRLLTLSGCDLAKIRQVLCVTTLNLVPREELIDFHPDA